MSAPSLGLGRRLQLGGVRSGGVESGSIEKSGRVEENNWHTGWGWRLVTWVGSALILDIPLDSHSAWAAGNLAPSAVLLGKIVEHTNQSHPNSGNLPLSPPCAKCFTNIAGNMSVGIFGKKMSHIIRLSDSLCEPSVGETVVDVVVDHVVPRVVGAEKVLLAVVVVLLLYAPLLLQVGVVPQQLVSTFKLNERLRSPS